MILSLVVAGSMLELTSRTPVLTYHDIIPSRTKESLWFDCTVDEFRHQIGWLKKKGATFVSATDIFKSILSRKPLPKKAVCITFADNYEGFYRYAWPIIRRERIPVTQFVHTGFIGSKVGRPKMTWDQLVELDRSGFVTVASQTVSHPADLTKMTNQQVLKEFQKSREALTARLGHPVSLLAYPNGKFDVRVSGLAKQAGYSAAFTEECRPAEKARNLFEIPRYVHTKYQSAWSDSNLNR